MVLLVWRILLFVFFLVGSLSCWLGSGSIDGLEYIEDGGLHSIFCILHIASGDLERGFEPHTIRRYSNSAKCAFDLSPPK